MPAKISNDKSPKLILAVFAHPDDESFTMSGLIAKYAKKGVETALITATLGQAGTKKHIKKSQNLAQVREGELRECVKLLKIKRLYLLGYHDGHLHQVDTRELESRLKTVFKKLNPTVVITFGPRGVTGHVDHVAISRATTNVFKKVCDPQNTRLLYIAPLEKHVKRRETGLSSRLSATGAKRIVVHKDHEIDVMVDIRPVWQFKLKAMRCHFSQDDVRALYYEIKKQPRYEECFKLALGRKFASKPAPDIFEGL